MNCSTRQAFDVWADLEDALAGRHAFGGDTAEVYGYRLRAELPTRYAFDHLSDLPEWCKAEVERADREAAADLRELAARFEERRSCRVFVVRGRTDLGRPIAEWDEPLTHRVHLRVEPAEVLRG